MTISPSTPNPLKSNFVTLIVLQPNFSYNTFPPTTKSASHLHTNSSYRVTRKHTFRSINPNIQSFPLRPLDSPLHQYPPRASPLKLRLRNQNLQMPIRPSSTHLLSILRHSAKEHRTRGFVTARNRRIVLLGFVERAFIFETPFR